MNKLDHDCLTLIFEILHNDKISLYPCLLVNRLWCEVAVPILWRNPWEIITKPFSNKTFKKAKKLFNTILLHLPEESIILLKSQEFDKPRRQISLFNYILNYVFKNQKNVKLLIIPQQKPLFSYISFCKYIKHQVYPYGPNFYEKVFQNYDARQIRLLEQEIYKLFIGKCYKINFLDTIGVKHPLYKFPGAEIS